MLKSDAAGFKATGRPFFRCATCSALYHIVKVEADAEAADFEIKCRVCGATLPSHEGQFPMKYFLLRNACRTQKWKRPKKGRAVQAL